MDTSKINFPNYGQNRGTLGVFPWITSDRFMNHDRLPFTVDLIIVRLTCLHSDLITNSEIGRIH